jgi:hypothetical protein
MFQAMVVAHWAKIKTGGASFAYGIKTEMAVQMKLPSSFPPLILHEG